MRKKHKKIVKIAIEFLFSFLAVSTLLFVIVNFGALKNKLGYWAAKTFGAGSDNYFSSSVDGLGVVGDLVPPDDRLVIPKIGINVPLVFADSFDNADMLESLNRGVLAYPGMALPGEASNTFLAGHSSQNPWEKGEYKNVFSLIDNLDAGDKLVVYYRGSKYVYEVDGSKVVASSDLSVLEPTNSAVITLMTCWPVGTTAKRLIIKGHLENGPAGTEKNGVAREGEHKRTGRESQPSGGRRGFSPINNLRALPVVR